MGVDEQEVDVTEVEEPDDAAPVTRLAELELLLLSFRFFTRRFSEISPRDSDPMAAAKSEQFSRLLDCEIFAKHPKIRAPVTAFEYFYTHQVQ